MATKDEAEEDELLQCIFESIIASDRVIKRQQRGEPKLSKREKITELKELLAKSPGSFLMRFGTVLNENQLHFFDNFDDYEVTYRLGELLKRFTSGEKKDSLIRNRRYKAIEVLTVTSDYFTENSMRERQPLLYEHYVGRFLSDEEKKQLERQQDKFTILSQIFDTTSSRKKSNKKEEEEEELSDDPVLAAQQKLAYRNEFITLMHLSFLNGQDKDYFDYSMVDDNSDYDDTKISDRDFEDRYFDSEEPLTITCNHETTEN